MGFEKNHIPWHKGKKTGIVTKGAFKKGKIPWNKGTKGLMPTPWNKGTEMPKETKMKVSEKCKEIWAKRESPVKCFKKGCKTWNKGLKGYNAGEKNSFWKGGETEFICEFCGNKFKSYGKRKFCSRNCKDKSSIGKISPKKGKPNYEMRGENHPRWKGGIGRHDLERKRFESVEWRRKIFARDGYKCAECESKKEIQAHHIKRWCDYPELRYEMDNGITLCKLCHSRTIGKEKEYEKKFKELLKKAVNSGKILTSKVEDNPEPSQESNLLEGATTRSRVLVGQ